MNALKHMEIIFVISAVLLGITGYATAAAPAIERLPQVVHVAPTDAKVQVVVINAKRLTAAQKAAAI